MLLSGNKFDNYLSNTRIIEKLSGRASIKKKF
jgi:hypothetical protein